MGPSERLSLEIQILGETCIEFLVKGKVADEGAGKEQKDREKKKEQRKQDFERLGENRKVYYDKT